MAPITRDLIKRKSEHNEGTLADLEEISLHQLEIERIEVIGTLCRKLKILYLQNNIISKIENLQHLKDLTYLNLALNNITVITGLQSCEFLQKLDLTLNFIGLDTLASSIDHLKQNKHLTEFHLNGNPSSDWSGYKEFVIGSLTNLDRLDGYDVTKSQRIRAQQSLERNRCDLKVKAAEALKEKEQGQIGPIVEDVRNAPDDERLPYTPQVRTEMYREMAEEKAEKEQREKERLPKERDYNKEHEQAVSSARKKPFFNDGRIRQCNEGGYNFRLDEDQKNMYIYVEFPRFLDTSLIDCDVHPTYVTIVAKTKTLRLATLVPGK